MSLGLAAAWVQPQKPPGKRLNSSVYLPTVGDGGTSPNIVKALRELRQPSCPNSVVLGRSDYRVLRIEKPAVKAEELEQSLRWAITPLLDFPASEANISWMSIPNRENTTPKPEQVYVAVCKQSVANTLTQLFSNSKTMLSAIDIRETGYRNIATLASPRSDTSARCLVAVESFGVQIIISRSGELYFERFIRETPFQADAENAEALAGAIDRLALEIQRTIDFMGREYSGVSVSSIQVAPVLRPIPLVRELSVRLSQAIEPLDLNDLFNFDNPSLTATETMQAQLMGALGTALRGIN